MIDPSIPASVADSLQVSHGIAETTAVGSGLSGASVFQCTNDQGNVFALRGWPAKTKVDRVREVHRVLQRARDNGCDLIPVIHPISRRLPNETVTIASKRCVSSHQADLPSASRLWELQDWLPGEPAPKNAGLDLIQNGAAAIARFHQAVADFGQQAQVAPAVQVRASRLREVDALLPKVLAKSMSSFDVAPLSDNLRGALFCASEVMRQKWPLVKNRISRLLDRYLTVPLTTQFVLRDVHREHILFEESGVSGLIDFDSIRVDTPLADIARWGGGFLADRENDEEVWQAVLAGYQQISTFPIQPTTERSVSFVRDIHCCSVWISLANWLIWIIEESRTFSADDDVIAGRVSELTDLTLRTTT